jgi:glycosyltransferase involved in cell wall biosynthesis
VISQENIPVIAVIVPARNEEKYIGRLLDSFVHVQYPKEKLRLVICDGMSEDKTQDIVNNYALSHSWIKLLVNVNRTTPYAFNQGIRFATDADIFITVGAHAEVYPDFMEQVVKCFSISPDIGCVGGILENVYENELAKAIGLAMSSPFGVGNAHFRTGEKEGEVDTVGFPAYKKEVFEKVGLFNETLSRNQDDEFNYRVARAGFKIWLSKSIRSKYYVRGSFEKLSRQYFQYGYWKVYVNRLHKTVTTYRQLIPPAFVVFLILGLILSCCSVFLAGCYAGILLVYILGAFYFASKIATDPGETLRIVYAFFILHFFYGAGYVKGLFDFALLGKKPSQKAETLTR